MYYCSYKLFIVCFVVSVGSSHQLKVSVSKVTLPQYESLHSDLHEIRKAGTNTVLFTFR